MAQQQQQRVISVEELAEHSSAESCWVAIRGKVYDVTQFLADHPGGKNILLREGGKDATAKFDAFHEDAHLAQFGPAMLLGVLAPSPSPSAVSASASGSAGARGGEARAPVAGGVDPSWTLHRFGSQFPFADPAWYQGQRSPYYDESHHAWRKTVRAFAEQHMMAHCAQWDDQGFKNGPGDGPTLPLSVYREAGRLGILAAAVSQGTGWPTAYWGPCPVPGGRWDPFHELIMVDELCRIGSGGAAWALIEGPNFCLPPVLQHGSEAMKRRVLVPCLRGEKFSALCVSEPWAGSDVAGLRSTARRDGDHYILNGAKKWITNGCYADFFIVGARTGPPGLKGLSLFLVDRDLPGVTVRKLRCTGMWPSGTAYITFEDVRVHADNRIGSENDGFKMIVYNFNHERWVMVAQCCRMARVCLEEAFRYAMQRRTFGKRLIDHQMLRGSLSELVRKVEALQAWLDQLTFQLKVLPHAEHHRLGGPIALAKVHATKTLQQCATAAIQVFGGAGYVRGGKAQKVERIHRDLKGFVLGGGSEEVLADFSMRQAVRIAEQVLKPKAKL